MSTAVWRGAATNTAQVTTAQITGYDASTSYRITLTDDNSATVVISASGTTDVNGTATALAAAWNASTDPRVARITASANTDTVTLTADTAGRPFTVASSVSGGTGTIGATSTTTANSGSSDYGTAANWSTLAVPTTSDNVVLPAGVSGSIQYGLNQSSVAITSFTVEEGCSLTVGRFEDGFAYHLRIDPDAVTLNGSSSRVMIDVGSWNGTVNVQGSGSPSAGYSAVYLKGSNIATVNITGGNVGIGTTAGDSTTTVATTNASGTSNYEIGSGVSLTTLLFGGSSQGELNCAATTVTQNSSSSSLTTNGSGAITTLTVNGTVTCNSTGTITTLNADGGTADFTKSLAARTVTTANLRGGSILYDDASLTITNAIAGTRLIRVATAS